MPNKLNAANPADAKRPGVNDELRARMENMAWEMRNHAPLEGRRPGMPHAEPEVRLKLGQ